MRDIVERLRGKADWQEREGRSLRLYNSSSPSMPELAEMHEESATAMRSAADEIERLRAEVHTLSTTCGHCGDLERAWEAVAAARREGIEIAAREMECGCPDETKAAVLEAMRDGHNSVKRWQACGHSQCSTIDAFNIRTLLEDAQGLSGISCVVGHDGKEGCPAWPMNWTIPQAMLNSPPRGCICPPGANVQCENQYCPRKPLPSVSAQLRPEPERD